MSSDDYIDLLATFSTIAYCTMIPAQHSLRPSAKLQIENTAVMSNAFIYLVHGTAQRETK
jgi:hypothetical protein